MQPTYSQVQERWKSIVTALVLMDITPDLITFAALSAGVEQLGRSLGVQKRAIGFAPSKEPR